MKPVHYTISASQPAAHLFEVSLTIDDPDPAGQAFFLPSWIPGSYMIREFARNIVQIKAEMGDGSPVAIEKTSKDRWWVGPSAKSGSLTLRYQVYAWDLSVRSAHLDDRIGFFNGTSVFLAVEGREAAGCLVEIKRPQGPTFSDWRVATALREAESTARYGFGLYEADNYDELIDHPVTLGEFELASFDAHGVPHDIVISGGVASLDMERLKNDLKSICEAQIRLFEPQSLRAPMRRYVFMTVAVSDGYGGLEHRASTALIAKRSDFPVLGAPADAPMTDGYRTYLGLCSHEYFHTWNVKRIKPDTFAPYDLRQETYTPLLWLFEGFTSYYDDLILVRSGVIGKPDYFKLLGKTIGGVLRGSGRRKQSVAESSFDAWVKYYRQDENASNAIVSYYTKGSLVALAFDLAIRSGSNGERSLDDVMRALWQRYGRDFYEGEAVGITPQAVLPLLNEVSGLDLSDLYQTAVNGTDDLPLADLLNTVGIVLSPVSGSQTVSLGARIKNAQDVSLAAVFEGGAAQRAGLSAGDVLVSVNGLRVSGGNLDGLLGRYQAGAAVELYAFRRDMLRCFTVQLDGPEVTEYNLSISETKGKTALASLALQDAWLAG